MKVWRDFGARAAIALISIISLIVMIFLKIPVPDSYMALVTMAVTFYFANRNTLNNFDKDE